MLIKFGVSRMTKCNDIYFQPCAGVSLVALEMFVAEKAGEVRHGNARLLANST